MLGRSREKIENKRGGKRQKEKRSKEEKERGEKD